MKDIESMSKVTTISVEPEVKRALARLGTTDMTYNDVLKRLLAERENKITTPAALEGPGVAARPPSLEGDSLT